MLFSLFGVYRRFVESSELVLALKFVTVSLRVRLIIKQSLLLDVDYVRGMDFRVLGLEKTGKSSNLFPGIG